MISFIPMVSTAVSPLPRRDLTALYPYLNRRELEGKSPGELLDRVEGVLQQLAAASRMQ